MGYELLCVCLPHSYSVLSYARSHQNQSEFGVSNSDSNRINLTHNYTQRRFPMARIIGDNNDNQLIGTLDADLIRGLDGSDRIRARAHRRHRVLRPTSWVPRRKLRRSLVACSGLRRMRRRLRRMRR